MLCVLLLVKFLLNSFFKSLIHQAQYPIRRPNDKIVNVPPHSDEDVIAQLDSAMNNWMDTVPCHRRWTDATRYYDSWWSRYVVRWNPTENTEFLPQSAVLHATYYHLQIFIHRPFIPSPRNHSRATFPSLTICTNAARSCCHVLESFTKWSAMPFVLLQVLYIWRENILLRANFWIFRFLPLYLLSFYSWIYGAGKGQVTLQTPTEKCKEFNVVWKYWRFRREGK